LQERSAGPRSGLLKVDPLARTPSLPPTGGRGVGMAPSLGKGWGMGNPTQTEAVSPSPGPPLKDPPTSPPHRGMGAPWGDDGGPMGAGAALSSSGAAAKRRRPHHLSSGGCRGRRDTKLTEGQRLARRSSRCHHVFKDSGVQGFWTSSGPAPGMAGDRGDGLAGGTRPQQSGGSGSTASPSSGLVRAQREGNQARDPRARERAAVSCRPVKPAMRRPPLCPRAAR
jgi:hypothetical protein